MLNWFMHFTAEGFSTQCVEQRPHCVHLFGSSCHTISSPLPCPAAAYAPPAKATAAAPRMKSRRSNCFASLMGDLLLLRQRTSVVRPARCTIVFVNAFA